MKKIYRNLIVLAAALVLPLNVFADGDGSGIVLSKKVTDNGNGKYTLTLETYTTGETVKTTSVAPTDFVLVLDNSGSMSSNTDVKKEEKVSSGTSLSTSTTYVYYLNDERYYLKYLNRGIGTTPRYVWVYSKNATPNWNNKVGYFEGNSYKVKPDDEIYTETKITRKKALQNAFASFVQSVYDNNPAKGYHRIAIVWYGQSAQPGKTLKDYNLHDLTEGTKNSLISNISGTGGNEIPNTGDNTYCDLGFKQAASIIEANQNDGYDKVVVFFTDGEPGWHSGYFVNETARASITETNKIKEFQNVRPDGSTKNATVFAVGLMTSGTASRHYEKNNGSDYKTNVTNDKYRFMHYVSSNYDLGNSNISNYSFDTNLSGATNINPEAGNGITSPWGYFKQTDGSDLDAIFANIAIENANTNFGVNEESAVVLDALTNMFKLPAGATVNDIDLYTCDAKTNNTGSNVVWVDSGTGTVVKKDADNNVLPDSATSYDHKELWVAWEPWNDTAVRTAKKEDGKTLKYDFNGNGSVEVTDFIWINSGKVGMASGESDYLEVMGYDFASNFVGPSKEGTTITGWKGQKLIIQFEIETDEANTGGVDLNTNDPCSGVYVKDAKTGNYTAIEKYEIPTVYLPYLKIIKKGLEKGASAIFTVTKVNSDTDQTAATTDAFSAEVVLVKTGDDEPYAIVKLRHQGWYKVEETDWTWTYSPATGSSASSCKYLETVNASATEIGQAYITFEFNNAQNDALKVISAEAAVINDMGTASNKQTTSTED